MDSNTKAKQNVEATGDKIDKIDKIIEKLLEAKT